MPPLSSKCTAARKSVPTSKFHGKEAGDGYLPVYWPRNRDKGGRKKWGRGVLLRGLQTVNVNSTWESIIKMPVKDNAPHCILYSVARNVSECWSMYVWAGPGGDCNCTRDPLKWPSAWGLTVLSNINPHPPYMPYFHISPSWLSYGVATWCLCVCAS